MMNMYRNRILELFDEGLVGKDEMITNLVNWLSEQDAKEFWEQYYYDMDEDPEFDEQRAWYDTSAELL